MSHKCAIPVLDGLFPDHEDDLCVRRVLFIAAYWHSLAKLRMHTTTSISIFRSVTKLLGTTVRDFCQTTCLKIAARELPREANARLRRQAQRLVRHQVCTA